MVYVDFVSSKPIYINNEKSDYEIFSNGDVWSNKSHCFMKGGKDKNGYHIISLSMNGKKYTRKIHRLVAIAFIENPLNLPEVNHKNGNKWNNDISNLEWVSSADNTYHAMENKLRNSTLNKKLVVQICKEVEKGNLSLKEIANKYNVKRSSVIKILNKQNWCSISDMYDFSNYTTTRGLLGSQNNNSKISEKDARKIKKLLKSMSATEISKQTGISRGIIYSIK